MFVNQNKTRGENLSKNSASSVTAVGHKGRDAIQFEEPCKDAKRDWGIYVHVPFCTHKCPYCDFATVPIRGSDDRDRYVSALQSEIGRTSDFGWTGERNLVSIFLGGGTPSLLSPEQLSAVLGSISQSLSHPLENLEITLEINPEDVTLEQAKKWRRIGINRASLGVQSMVDQELRRLERIHSAETAQSAFRALRGAHFENVSVDLIFGLEGQSLEQWRRTLENVLSWEPDHISAYNLTIEEKTKFGSELRVGKFQASSDDLQVSMLLETRALLSNAGYDPYEISNFARGDFSSRHNLLYWTGKEYWGVGMSAHSFQIGENSFRRWWNPRNQKAYLAGPSIEEEKLSREMHFGERLMTGLRLAAGVDLAKVSRDLEIEPSASVLERLHTLVESGHMIRSGDTVCLTEKGIVVSNEIFRDLLPTD